MNSTVTKFSKAWQVRKQAMRKTVDDFVSKSRVLESLGFHDLGDEIRTVLVFKTRTLVHESNGNVIERGPVIVGVRYNERFLSEAPHPAEIVTILQPFPIFAPNIARTGALCLGHPNAGIQLAEILHMTWAAITFNLRVVDTIEWHGFQPDAAQFVRRNPQRFPLTDRGLFEAEPVDFPAPPQTTASGGRKPAEDSPDLTGLTPAARPEEQP